MFPYFNFRHTNRREIEAGVKAALEEHEREKQNKEIERRIAEENARKENRIRNTPRRPITYDEVESVIAMVMNQALTLSTSSVLLEHAGRIVNTLEEMLHIMAEKDRLQKIVDGPKFSRDGELCSFCGLPVDEAIDTILCYEEAIRHIPHNCQTCRYNPGIDVEFDACSMSTRGYSATDGVCRWGWNMKFIPDNSNAEEALK